MTNIKTRKKLIEVALPLEAINRAAAHEKMPGIGAHPRGLHHWWARRPFTCARAIIFAQLVDDPSANAELFKNEKAQDKERKRLFKIIEDLAQWENTKNEALLSAAKEEIWASWRRACADNADHPRAKELFNRGCLPAFHDPFAGGGALPLEAQRLGLESFASDLNPVAVLINKAMIEIPSRFSGWAPVNPDWTGKTIEEKSISPWKGIHGLSEDLNYYAKWMLSEAKSRIGNLYPSIEISNEVYDSRPDLEKYRGRKLKVISWIWARTVKSPNPACSEVAVPLATSFMLSTKPGRSAYVEPVKNVAGYSFIVKVGVPADPAAAKAGTKLSRGANFRCLMSDAPIGGDYIKAEGQAGRMGVRLMAIVAEGDRERVHLSPTAEHERIALEASPAWSPDTPLANDPRALWTPSYGLKLYGQLFTSRQLVALTELADLVTDACAKVEQDMKACGKYDKEYVDAIAQLLAFAVSRSANFNNSLTVWAPTNEKVMFLFNRQAIPMVWSYGEANILENVVGGFQTCAEYISSCLLLTAPGGAAGSASQADASTQTISTDKVISTDPPYYDNIGYADLSDFFYVWLRRSLHPRMPALFSTMATPKVDELVANPYRHGGRDGAEDFFLTGMTGAMRRLATQAHPAYPLTIYYAFRQSETDGEGVTTNTGWDTFLAAMVGAGFQIVGTWPVRSEMITALKANINALASSIVIVCRRREEGQAVTTKREFIDALKNELPAALLAFQTSYIAPVDLAQAAIGPGMAIFTRYSKVVGSDGVAMTVREALKLVNEVLDAQLVEQESNWDADTRWAVIWFDQCAFSNGEFGQAQLLARAKNTAVQGVVEAGIASSSAGKVRLLKPEELPLDWAPETDARLTVWEMLHHLVRLQKQGESLAAAMLARLGEKAEAAKELAYRLYGICERKKRSAEGQLYNDLIVVWPDLLNQSKQAPTPTARPGEFELDA